MAVVGYTNSSAIILDATSIEIYSTGKHYGINGNPNILDRCLTS